jgi:hypothetical protein
VPNVPSNCPLVDPFQNPGKFNSIDRAENGLRKIIDSDQDITIFRLANPRVAGVDIASYKDGGGRHLLSSTPAQPAEDDEDGERQHCEQK